MMSEEQNKFEAMFRLMVSWPQYGVKDHKKWTKIKSSLYSHIYTQIVGIFMLITNIYKYDIIWDQRSQTK